MGRMVVETRVYSKALELTEREQLLMFEIGSDRIDSASSFVNYISEMYGFSKSSVWYTLNRLRERGLADFASKEEPGKGLSLTNTGMAEMRGMEHLRAAVIGKFSSSFLGGAGLPATDDGTLLRASMRARA